ncbi:hypothetical protein CAPTEDRAFT_214187 [Capitella teleta]|uniref:Immunoglobulin I-set domain-containing protein n=1 Tax=Capitella teleta TaxID=283909 RepID=R7TR22_CAPTE|nr:hypothetical protein CAPTEDRAFT_214187 [Capitella teleta]|eukprot:ELT96027.1 hypothetical protein CAPTEDRAFT_214187 [Capitella teleta]
MVTPGIPAFCKPHLHADDQLPCGFDDGWYHTNIAMSALLILCVSRLKERQAILSEDPHYAVTADDEDSRFSLCITDTLADDAGWYMCLAHNEAGTAYSEAQLLVESK